MWNDNCFPRQDKRYVIVKKFSSEKIKRMPGVVGVGIVTTGRNLGGFVEDEDEMKEFSQNKKEEWYGKIDVLTVINENYPYKTLSYCTNAVQYEWGFEIGLAVAQTGDLMNDLEERLWQKTKGQFSLHLIVIKIET